MSAGTDARLATAVHALDVAESAAIRAFREAVPAGRRIRCKRGDRWVRGKVLGVQGGWFTNASVLVECDRSKAVIVVSARELIHDNEIGR